jgi:hypothetical protein
MMSILCMQYEWVKSCNIGAKWITLQKVCASLFSLKKHLYIKIKFF